jgi:hypothetical protein
MPIQISWRNYILILAACIAVLLFLILAPALHQSQAYHNFADQRTILGIPHFWDVVSNLPFLVVGLVGLFGFRDLPLRILFFGVFSTAFGSAYYHWDPNNSRLFWDRLPMTIVFMSLVALAIHQRKLVLPLVLVGVMSVVWWRIADNLWPYGLVQFGSMVAIVVIAIRSEPGLWPVIIFYGFSKITEYFDKQIYSCFPLSGHTLKHLTAGIAAWYIYRWFRFSRPQTESEKQPAVARA